MEIRNFQQFKNVGAKKGTNTISVMRSLGFIFSSGFYRRNNIKDFKYIVLFYNKDDGGSIGFAFTNNEEAEGKFMITHSKEKTHGSTTARSFFLNYELDRDIEKYAGKYEVKETGHHVFGKIYYISLNEKVLQNK